MPTVVVQKWEESERGWGVRPDGYSVHFSEEDLAKYLADHKARYLKAYGDRVPDEYDRPSGTPYRWDATDDEIAHMQKGLTEHNGYRTYDRKYPGSGGTDGWVPYKPKADA